jgi:hypothetical protein
MLQTLEIVLRIFLKNHCNLLDQTDLQIDPKKKKEKPCHMHCALISLKFTDHENLNE